MVDGCLTSSKQSVATRSASLEVHGTLPTMPCLLVLTKEAGWADWEKKSQLASKGPLTALRSDLPALFLLVRWALPKSRRQSSQVLNSGSSVCILFQHLCEAAATVWQRRTRSNQRSERDSWISSCWGAWWSRARLQWVANSRQLRDVT